MSALIFDCDGVLADTEADGHRVAFNQAFEEFGIPVRWSVADYAGPVRIGGGKERLRATLTPELLVSAGRSAAPADRDELIAELHRRKTEIYTGLVAAGRLPGRPGVLRLARAAHAAGWAVACASTSAEQSVRAVLHEVVGELDQQVAVFAGDIVAAKKPAPDVYLAALAALPADPASTVVVEDSENGLRAALGAGLRTVVTTSTYTADEDFTGASLVVSDLGEPGRPASVRSDPYGIAGGAVVDLETLTAVLSHPVPDRGGHPGGPEQGGSGT